MHDALWDHRHERTNWVCMCLVHSLILITPSCHWSHNAHKSCLNHWSLCVLDQCGTASWKFVPKQKTWCWRWCLQKHFHDRKLFYISFEIPLDWYPQYHMVYPFKVTHGGLIKTSVIWQMTSWNAILKKSMKFLSFIDDLIENWLSLDRLIP